MSFRIPRHAALGLVLVFSLACGGSDTETDDVDISFGGDDAPPSKETMGIVGDDESSSGGGVDIDTSSGQSSGGESSGGESGSASASASEKPLYVPPQCGADCLAHDVPAIIAAASKKYNIPRWFYYAIIRRESSFDRCKTQSERAPNVEWGRGLTQVTFAPYAGVPYPQHLAQADDGNSSWQHNMGIKHFGGWIHMSDVTPIPSPPASVQECLTNPKKDDAYDPATNIERFSSGYAAPAYHLYRVATDSPKETWRKVAYHWHYGLWGSPAGKYPADPRPYLTCTHCYDAYVEEYEDAVEADDGVYAGPTCKPPYQASGC